MPGPSTWTCSSSLKAGSFFNTCSTIPTFHEKAGGNGQPGRSTIITSNCIMYSSMGCSGSVTIDSVAVSASLNPWTVNCTNILMWHVLSCLIGREHLSRLFFPMSHSITCVLLNQLLNISYQMSRPLGHSFNTWMEWAPCTTGNGLLEC